MKTVSPVRVQKSRLRCIDQGTIYDVTGKLRWLARSIDRGDEGEITDALVIMRRTNGSIGSYAFGPGGRERSHHMASTAKGRL